MDDLSMSIIDGRFAEQKVSIRSFVLDIPTSFCQFRLSNCGIHHVVYLIEEFGRSNRFSIPASSLNQAITNTQVCVFLVLVYQQKGKQQHTCPDLPLIILQFYNSSNSPAPFSRNILHSYTSYTSALFSTNILTASLSSMYILYLCSRFHTSAVGSSYTFHYCVKQLGSSIRIQSLECVYKIPSTVHQLFSSVFVRKVCSSPLGSTIPVIQQNYL